MHTPFSFRNAAALCAASLSFAACGTTAAVGGTVGTGDTASGADTSIDDASKTGSDGTAAVDSVADSKTDKADTTVVTDVQKSDTQTADTAKDITVVPSKGAVWGTDDKSGSVQKLTKLAFAATTDGCDLDGTGKKNTLGALKDLVGTKVQDAITGFKLIMLFDPKTYSFTGDPMLLNVLIGDQDASDTTCKDGLAAGCKFTAKPSSYTNNTCDKTSCDAQIKFPDATIKSGTLAAKSDSFTIAIALGTANLNLKISKVQLSGTVTDGTSWKTTKSGKLCGYITEADLNAALEAVPAGTLPMDAKTLEGLMKTLAKNDIDSTGTGAAPDSKSVALTLETETAVITGLSVK